MKSLITFSILLTFSLQGFSQQDKKYFEIAKTESQLKAMFDRLYKEEIPGSNIGLYHSIDSLFEVALNNPCSFDFAWDKLDKIGKLKSDDGMVKVFSWVYMLSSNEYAYTCFIQVMEKRNNYTVFKLNPGNSNEIKSENFAQTIENWHAKIYYEIITTKFKRKVFYTLLGADFNDAITSIKTIEVMTIQGERPVFRGDQFLDGGAVKDRLILEYSSDLASSVRYNKQLEMIVFDHLVPLHPLYHGNYQFYGPDGSYDGVKFVDGIWVKEEDVDARNRD